MKLEWMNQWTFPLPGCCPWHRPKQIGNRHAEHNNNLLAAISEVGGPHRFYVQRANSAARNGGLTLTAMQTCRNDKLNLFVTAQCPLSTAARYLLVRSEFMPFFFHSTIPSSLWGASLQSGEFSTQSCSWMKWVREWELEKKIGKHIFFLLSTALSW